MMHELQSGGEQSAGHGRRHRRAPALGVGVVVAFVALVAGNSAWADPPPFVKITPNAILEPDEPMEIAIKGPPGARIHIFILSNCDNDRETPEITPRAGCDPIIWRRGFDLDGRGDWKRRWMMTRVPKKYHGQTLWLRVSLSQDARWPYGDAIFTMVSDPCSVWDTFVDLFSDNECNADLRHVFYLAPDPPPDPDPDLAPDPPPDPDPDLLDSMPEMLDTMLRGSDKRPAAALEVRHLVHDDHLGTWAKPTSVRGTRGATGVAWADADSLLVTVVRVEEDVMATVDEPSSIVRPGLYRLDIPTGKRRLLLRARDGEVLAAPFAVRPDYAVFVRERVVASPDGTVATLAVWSRGRIIREFPLRQTIHQILAADSGQQSVLAYSRWQGVPALLRIDLRIGAVTHLGFPVELFCAVMRAPGKKHAVAAIEDRTGHNGWDLILVDGKGHLTSLVVGPGEALMPAWRPGRMELVYLGQPE